MAIYRVVAEQKITKKVLVAVEANSDEEAMNKVKNNDIISAETTLNTRIDKYIPLEVEK
ncbi:hypothetical protein AWH56_008690 [Anaerobacillus isosaccharinicus]|uniref:Uncharacterized protein n=1 Tax=Anaerobacillus isosaccharinicus TaxID=1532552 RepID=A0A7S7RD56_9BACI|nr:hypothetical protein [Anaerobacillus isosaccharinicus]MBA5588950.1 hypothetical protein [Anaerobacillus isosaccharinicus]QOY37641.1 hypothetical protein AWH56_008690 [Anaerobacillus isosaccharinicus]